MNKFIWVGRPASQKFLLVLTALGLIFAGTVLFNASHINIALVLYLSLFTGLLFVFPIHIFNHEISLAHTAVLGAGLVYGVGTSIAATLIGSAAAMAVYRIFPLTQKARKYAFDLENGLFEVGRLLIPIYAAGWTSTTWGLGNWGLIGIFAGLHLIILVTEFGLSSAEHRGALKRISGTVLLIEIIPIPFILLAWSAFPSGYGALSIFAAIPALIAISLNQNVKMQSHLDRRVQDLSTLSEISNIIRYATDLDSLFIAVHQQLRALMGIKNFYVALYEPKEDTLWYPISVKHDEHQKWPRRPLTDRLTDRVIREKRPIMLARNAHLEMDKVGMMSGKDRIEAWLGVPLMTTDRILGCLCIVSFNPETEFTKNDLDLLTTLSGQISVALENALLYDQMKKRSLQLEILNKSATAISATLNPKEVYAQICKAAVQISGGKQTALYIAQAPAKEAQIVHSLGLSPTFTKKFNSFQVFSKDSEHADPKVHKDVVQNIKNAEIAEDERQALTDENIAAYINLPFHTPDGNEACLSIFYSEPQNFELEEMEFLQTFATQASMALANASLHMQTDQALRKSVAELRILEEIGRKLSEALRSDELFDLILNYALEYTGSPWGSIVIYDSNNNQYVIKAQAGYSMDVEDVWNMQGISGRALQNQQVINVGDITQDADYYDVTGGKTRSQLSVPLIREDQTLGVLTLESPNLDEYTDEEVAFIGQLADQAAVAVLNAQLYDETQKWLNEQATLYLVSTRLAGNQNLESILNTVSQAFSAALDSHLVGVYIWDASSNTFQLRSSMQRDPSPTPNLPEIISETQYEFIQRQRTKTGPLVIGQEIEMPEEMPMCEGCQGLIFPLKFRGQIIGLSFVHIPASRKISDKDLQLPESIALQSSISIQNALLFSDVAQGRDRLQTVLDVVGEGVLMVDANGVVTLGNTPIERITNTPIEDIQNQNLTGLADHVLNALGYTYDEAYELVIQSVKPHRARNQPKHNYKFGEHYLERSTVPVWDLDDNVLGWVIVIRDVTEEHQVNQTRELLTETLVHDLRSPVGAVKTTLDLIEDIMSEESGDDIIPQSIQIAQRSTDRVLVLIESLLNISQLESGNVSLNKEDTDFVKVLGETFHEMIPVANENGIILSQELPKKLPNVKVDQNLIKRVVVNLLDNAFKFSPEGGSVLLKADTDEEDQIVVHVIDNGPGVPIEYREQIFERFSQIPNLPGKRRGTGLGLTLCRLAVQAHGGEIWVEPNPIGQGSAFMFSLPTIKTKIKQSF